MWLYSKKLQYPVDIKRKNLKMAKYLMSQYGGPDSEMGAAIRYLNQRYTMPDDKGKALLTDIGTEELAHLEIIASMINSLIENSALELASFGVRVNGVAPGFVQSDFRKKEFNEINDKFLDMIKNFNLLEKKNLDPEKVADAILFLASDEAEFMTGEIITIDNGFELNHDLSFIDDRE